MLIHPMAMSHSERLLAYNSNAQECSPHARSHSERLLAYNSNAQEFSVT